MINIHNKYHFKDEQGIIPAIVKPLLDKRAETKKQMKTAAKQEYKSLHIKQYALKVLANSFYGCLGFRHFRLYKREVADAITYTARMIIKEVSRWFEEKGFEIIYGDTDSVFISMGKHTIEDMEKLKNEINEHFKTYFKQFGVKDENNIFELEFEKVYKTIFFKLKSSGEGTKKKYVGLKIWES